MLSSSKSNAKQQWKEKGIDDRGEPEQTPALETSTVLSAASSDEDSITTSDSSNTTSVHCSENDPYADVRDQLESLSANCKARFVQQDDSNNDSNNLKQTHQIGHDSEAIPSFAAYTTYLGYAVLIFFGHIRDFLAKIFRKGRYLRVRTDFPSDDTRTYATLLKSWENFYTRRLYHRIQDCFSRPISSSPGAHIHVLERVSNDGNKTMDVLGTLQNLNTVQQQDEYTNGPHFQTTPDDQTNVVRHCLNLGSYNYLGFADDWNVTCKKSVMSSLNTLPVSVASTRAEYGTTTLHKQVEQLLSSFLGKDDAIVLNMGFNTNATTIPALVSNGDLLISDALNHTSIVNGARASGASIRTFNHNDTKHLDKVLREAIVMGRPRTRRPWNKIMVIVEGIYSMEGEYSDLKNIVKVCKKYGAYVYLDEAHSIGAMGPTGRGICEYTDVDTKDIDVMMGTFTKSFGGMGGYIAGSKDVIAFLRKNCAGSSYHNALSPVVCQQIISSFKVSYISFQSNPFQFSSLITRQTPIINALGGSSCFLFFTHRMLSSLSLLPFLLFPIGHYGLGRYQHWKTKIAIAPRQLKLLSHAPYRNGSTRAWPLRFAYYARYALQSNQDCCIFTGMSQTWFGSGGGWISCSPHSFVQSQILYLCWAHQGRFGQGTTRN